MNTITIELCAEDRKRLDVISDTLELIRLAVAEGKAVAPVVAHEEPKEEETPGQPSVNEAPVSVEESPTEEPEAPAAEPAKVVELADIQKKVVELSAAGKRDEVRNIVMEYAKRVSAIPADKTAEVWDRLTALEG